MIDHLNRVEELDLICLVGIVALFQSIESRFGFMDLLWYILLILDVELDELDNT